MRSLPLSVDTYSLASASWQRGDFLVFMVLLGAACEQAMQPVRLAR